MAETEGQKSPLPKRSNERPESKSVKNSFDLDCKLYADRPTDERFLRADKKGSFSPTVPGNTSSQKETMGHLHLQSSECNTTRT